MGDRPQNSRWAQPAHYVRKAKRNHKNPHRKKPKLQGWQPRSPQKLRHRHYRQNKNRRQDSPSHPRYHNRMRYSLLLTLLITSIASAQPIKQSDIEAALKSQFDEIDHYLDQRIADAANDRRVLHKYDFSSLEAYEKSIENLRPKLAAMLGGLDYPKLDLKPTQEL